MIGTFTTKDWVIDLLNKTSKKNLFFDPTRLHISEKVTTLYSSKNEQFTPGDLTPHLKATVPEDSAGGEVTATVVRGSTTYASTSYPKGGWYVDDSIVVEDFNMLADTTYTHKFYVSKGDKIYFRFNASDADAGVTTYSITLAYDGDYYTYN